MGACSVLVLLCFGDALMCRTLEGLNEAFAEYPPSTAAGSDNRHLAANLLGDLSFICGSRFLARAMSSLPGAAPVFLYRFNRKAAADQTPAVYGVSHGSEVPFVFDHGDWIWTDSQFTPAEQGQSKQNSKRGPPMRLREEISWLKKHRNPPLRFLIRLLLLRTCLWTLTADRELRLPFVDLGRELCPLCRSILEGGAKATHQRPLGAVACCALLLLTCALLMTSSRIRRPCYGHGGRVGKVCSHWQSGIANDGMAAVQQHHRPGPASGCRAIAAAEREAPKSCRMQLLGRMEATEPKQTLLIYASRCR